MSTPDQRYQEKLRARAEKRAPVMPQPVAAFPKGAGVDARYLAKLAARAAGQSAQAPKTEEKAAEAPAEETPAGAATEPKTEEAKPEAQQSQGNKQHGNQRR